MVAVQIHVKKTTPGTKLTHCQIGGLYRMARADTVKTCTFLKTVLSPAVIKNSFSYDMVSSALALWYKVIVQSSILEPLCTTITYSSIYSVYVLSISFFSLIYF